MKVNGVTTKSPLRYPGGKTRAVKYILKYIPNHIKTLCAPFIGGGSVELVLASRGITVYGFDNFKPLVTFWNELITHPKQLSKTIQRYYPLTSKEFYSLQKTYTAIKNKPQQAAVLYVLNRASFSGVTFQGGMSKNHPRFTQKGIDTVAQFKVANLSIRCMDFELSIANHPHDFLYLDPPYYNTEQLYGFDTANTHFPHERLATILKTRKQWIVSYNDCTYIRNLYEGYTIKKLKWKYGMNKTKKSNEILILSHR